MSHQRLDLMGELWFKNKVKCVWMMDVSDTQQVTRHVRITEPLGISNKIRTRITPMQSFWATNHCNVMSLSSIHNVHMYVTFVDCRMFVIIIQHTFLLLKVLAEHRVKWIKQIKKKNQRRNEFHLPPTITSNHKVSFRYFRQRHNFFWRIKISFEQPMHEADACYI